MKATPKQHPSTGEKLVPQAEDTADSQIDVATVARRVGLVTLWTFQYAMIAPMGLLLLGCWKATKLFGWGVLLIFVPLIGWAVLYLRYRDRAEQRRHEEVMTAIAPTYPPLRVGPTAVERLVQPWAGGAW